MSEHLSERESILRALTRLGLVLPGQHPDMAPLTGGVSSDIWRVDLPDGPICVKRALARLKVAQLWEAPVARNHYEWAWFQVAARFRPKAVPPLLAEDRDAGLFAMGYLDPADYPVWKALLRDGVADAAFAASVGETLAAFHSGTAGDSEIARDFATDDGFHAIRLEPYLLATARAHPDLAPALEELARVTARNRRALVHGDVSPKNILAGPDGPVFLDAECAWYGDPAFDLAFCLNHLLLKSVWNPGAARGFAACFRALAAAYFAGARFEAATTLETRIARLLPGLLLARVDGKSPVEYITVERDKTRVRHVGRALLAAPPERLSTILDAWEASARP